MNTKMVPTTDWPNAPSDIARRMDNLPVTLLHITITAVCAFGFAFDLMEMAMGNVLSAVFSVPPHGVAGSQLALLLSAVYMGAIFGAPLLGYWADRHGRKTVLLGALVWLSATSVLAAASPGVNSLSVARALSGFALGAYPPLMFAYLTDILPPGRRGLLSFITVAAGSLGPPAGIFFVRALSPTGAFGIEAWRWAFVLGAAGAAVAALLFRALPESPRWLQVRGRDAEASKNCERFERSAIIMGAIPPGDPPADPGNPRADIARSPLPVVSLLYFLSPWSTVAFPMLIGAVLIDKGFRLSDTLLFVGVSMFGLFFGSALSAAFVDRVQRRTAMAVCAIAMTACSLVFALSSSPAWLIASSTLFVLFAALYLPTLTMYGAEIFPTGQRARFSSIAWAFNRVGAAAAPFVLLPLLHGAGALAMMLAVGAMLLGSLVVMWFCPAGYAGRAVP